ncbi:hypothetical protein E2562_006195 [Oryza meyeriana var. granulata]|uniref:Uncharacterized protein n=1 Tax=Oryza meyeriana var. granulata TaxID=110450 RepID=A0A6G1CNJ3_9ORYZ|nr:hypothetical protein E2562_006195 [Oryza meyeriana var. granulata]
MAVVAKEAGEPATEVAKPGTDVPVDRRCAGKAASSAGADPKRSNPVHWLFEHRSMLPTLRKPMCGRPGVARSNMPTEEVTAIAETVMSQLC